MNLLYNRILSILVLTLFSNIGFSQLNSIEIEFIGNCGLYMTDGKNNIYVDFPYKSGAYNYMEFDKSELDSIKQNSIFIFTHKHADHFSGKNMRDVLKEKGGIKFTPWKSKKLIKYVEKIPELDIEIFKTKHKFSLKHVSYLITWHGKRIYLSGDTTDPETIGGLENIDWAFLPYWILNKAYKQEIEIDAKMFGVYHIATVQIPSAKKNYKGIDNVKPMINQGKKIKIEL